jgi:hypothetical protein
MSVLEDLLPAVSTEALAALLAAAPEDRLTENLFFEFKATVTHVAKSVAAFANAEGGFIMFGATAENGRLLDFPGLPAGTEWPVQINNLIVGHVSPLPAWAPTEVRSPTTGAPVVVVRVPRSSGAPHVLSHGGAVYIRQPGGTSEPIKDRATLDALLARGSTATAAVDARFAAFHGLREPPLMEGEARCSVVAVPLPFGGVPQAWPVTQSGCKGAAQRFTPSEILRDAPRPVLLEDGVELDFGGRCRVCIYTDGTAWLRWTDARDKQLALGDVYGAVIELLVALRRFSPPVHEVALEMSLRSFSVTLREGSAAAPYGIRLLAPERWCAREEGAIVGEAVRGLVLRLLRRLWRAAGAEAYEPEVQ